MDGRIYEGIRTSDGCNVTVRAGDSRKRPLSKRLDLFNHSPSGFEWSYAGSGPAQLALAILADHFKYMPEDRHIVREPGCTTCKGDGFVRVDGVDRENCTDCIRPGDETAIRHHQAFKRLAIATLPSDQPWKMMSQDVRRFLQKIAH